MIDKELLKDDELKYRLSLRSKNKPATCFEWQNPLMADGVPIYARHKTTYSDPNIRVSYNNFQVIQKLNRVILQEIFNEHTQMISLTR